jgi:hypothetical protein
MPLRPQLKRGARSRLSLQSWAMAHALGLLLAVGGLACTSSDGGSATRQSSEANAAQPATSPMDRSPAASTASGCSLPSSYGTVACDECIHARCCEELATCNGDAECQAGLECTLGCVGTANPPQCFASCFGGSGPPAAFSAFDDCTFFECEAACFE